MRQWVWWLVLVVLASCEENRSSTEELRKRDLINANEPLDQLLDDKQIHRLVVDKSDRILSVLALDDTLKQYPIVLGSNPIDDKRMEGDRCTPEGEFKIRDMYPHAKWSKFIWIDYPNDDSRTKFRRAKRDGDIPMDATIGGEVGLHGVPEGKDIWIDQGKDWTWGCVSMKNAHIDEVYHHLARSASVLILP